MEVICSKYLSIMFVNIIVLAILVPSTQATSETTVTTSAPVHPVKEGAILSLHCQISNLGTNHYVTISRQLDNSDELEILSFGENVLGNVADSVFLAVRQLNDGSIIYFLSIIGVTFQDQGKYTCKVMPNSQDRIIAMDSSDIKIQYFPRDPNPLCTPKTQGLTVYEGTLISLNCTSDTAFPQVSLEWRRTGEGRVHETNGIVRRNGVSFKELRIRATLNDEGAVFLCELKSPAFPEKTKSCHVGPITVLRNPNNPTNSNDNSVNSDLPTILNPPFPGLVETATTSLELYTQKDTKDNHGDKMVADCREVCSSFSSPKFFWVVATVVACVLAFVFFIMGASLLWKYRQAHAQQQTYYATSAKPFPAHPTREYIYTELDSKRGVPHTENIGSCVYMSLERRENHANQTDLPRVKSAND